jgi:hypothetical protein
MSNVNIYKNSASTLPKKDEQIVRIDFETMDLAGRKGHIPSPSQSGQLGIQHVPSAGSKT